MSRREVHAAIARARLIGVIRAQGPEEAAWAARAAIAGGLELVEVTFTTPQAERAIAMLAQAGIMVGAGTILDVADARRAIAAGARFLVSPHTDPAVIATAQEADVWVAAGTATPTEMLVAHRLGADGIKIFPAEALGGARFVKLVRDPLPFLPLMPTGGVNADNMAAYLEAGCLAVGVSSALFPQEALARREDEAIALRARELVARAVGAR